MSAVSTFLDNLFATLFKDEAAVLQPVADNYLTTIIANPAPDNVVAQSLAFAPTAMAALPNVEAAAAKDTATALKAFLDAQIPSLVAAAATTASTTPAAPVAGATPTA